MLNTIENFLEQDKIDYVNDKINTSKGQPVWEMNDLGRWGQGLNAGSTGPVMILDLPEMKEFFIEKYKRVDPLFEQCTSVNCFAHLWYPGSHINWHTDKTEHSSDAKMSSTIYLSEHWDWNWGGLLVYAHENTGNRWIYPTYNACVWFKPPVWHCVTTINQLAQHPRVSIQLFFE